MILYYKANGKKVIRSLSGEQDSKDTTAGSNVPTEEPTQHDSTTGSHASNPAPDGI